MPRAKISERGTGKINRPERAPAQQKAVGPASIRVQANDLPKVVNPQG